MAVRRTLRVRVRRPAAVLLTAAALVASMSAQGGGGGAGVVSGGGSGASGYFVAPPPPPPLPLGTGALSGVVSDGMTGRPLAQAIVLLRMAIRDGAGRVSTRTVGQQMTDPLGRFVFTDLPPSDGYTVTARRFGYFASAFGASGPGADGMPVALADGQWFNRSDIAIWPTSAIGGRVLDDHGEPVVGAYVRAFRQIIVAGASHLAAAPPVVTDDRGIYRIAGLDPGRYIVCVPSVQATVPSTVTVPRETTIDLGAPGKLVVGPYPIAPGADIPMVFPISCYPGTSSVIQAASIDVRFGADQAAIDFRLHPVAAFRVNGRIDGPPEGLMGLTVRLVPAGSEELGYGAEVATALAGADGSFTLVGVPAGDYVIDARGMAAEYTYSPESSSSRFARMPGPPNPAGGGSSSFDMGSLAPRTGIRRAGSSAGVWARQPITIGTEDVAGVMVQLRPASSLTGRIVFDGSSDRPTAPLFVAAEPADGSPSRVGVRDFNLDAKEAFTIRDLLPGQYFLRLRGGGDTWTIRSIAWGGREFTHIPFDLSDTQHVGDVTMTLTDRAVELDGNVRDAQGRAVTDAAVIIFPVDPAAWRRFGLRPERIKSVRAGSSGTYRIGTLPAGDFYVAAIDPSRADHWHDPAFLEALASAASRVTLKWGERRSLDVIQVTLP